MRNQSKGVQDMDLLAFILSSEAVALKFHSELPP